MSAMTLTLILAGCIVLLLVRSLLGMLWPHSSANVWLDTAFCRDPDSIDGDGDGGGDGGD